MIHKLTTEPVRWGKHFCIAHTENGQLAEIEGRWVKGQYTVALLHQPAYMDTYAQYGIPATADEWQAAVELLYKQVAGMAAQFASLPPLPRHVVPATASKAA